MAAIQHFYYEAKEQRRKTGNKKHACPGKPIFFIFIHDYLLMLKELCKNTTDIFGDIL